MCMYENNKEKDATNLRGRGDMEGTEGGQMM